MMLDALVLENRFWKLLRVLPENGAELIRKKEEKEEFNRVVNQNNSPPIPLFFSIGVKFKLVKIDSYSARLGAIVLRLVKKIFFACEIEKSDIIFQYWNDKNEHQGNL